MPISSPNGCRILLSVYAVMCIAGGCAGEWLLDVTRDLLKPDLAEDFINDAAATPLRLGSASAGFRRRMTFEQRFSYFVRQVSRVRLWSERGHALFGRLKETVAEYMVDMSGLCHARFQELAAEEEGSALLAFEWKSEEIRKVSRQDDEMVGSALMQNCD